ncbi:MAG TPA: hypothetical protein VG496_15110 [Myxococcales bacterium]|nr:hypothetical protein [Myxococcales bacterium]
MTGHPTIEELEAIAFGEEPGADVAEHTRQCAECAREVSWLRTEAQLLRRRPRPVVDAEMLRRIEERVHAPIPISRARRFRVAFAAAAAVAAAVALAIGLRSRPPPSVPEGAVAEDEFAAPLDPKAQKALDQATGDYRNVLAVLEEEYSRARGRLDPRTQKRWDESFARARVLIDSTAQARNDPDERLRLLDGSAMMVRSLRHAIEDSEEMR